jgi:penicillin-binding protein 1A
MNRRLFLKLSLVVTSFSAVLSAMVAALARPFAMLGDVGTGEPNSSALQLEELERRSYVYDAAGAVLASLRGEYNREPVRLEDVPQHVVDAILAVEDAGFYSHDGVNGRSLIRAFRANVGTGDIEEGGSTITQQLVKLSLLTTEQTLDRKVQEIVLAMRLERQMTKDEILARYLNTVYFGNHCYGVQAAAETYFGVGVNQLDKGQAAMLAALIRNPVYYNPVRYPERAVERRRLALRRMRQVGYVTEEEETFFNATPIPTQLHQVLPEPRDYFVEVVKEQLLADERLGATEQEREQAVFQSGLRVHTTFDPHAQSLALQARDSQLGELGPGGVFDIGPDPRTGEMVRGTAAIVCIEQTTGAVRALVGGPGFDQYQYDLATENPRQGGSSHKTYVLATLMEQGYSPNDIVDGTGPEDFRDPGSEGGIYSVTNFDGSAGSVGSITQQTLRSSNCAYVRLGQIAGIPNVIDTMHKLGVTSELQPFPSLPLGSQGTTVLEQAGAYAGIANDGVYNRPFFIQRVEDAQGRVIFEHAPQPSQALSPQAARNVTMILEQNIQSGTGTAARISGRPAAGKTGTATNSKDAWFCGYSGEYTTAVWLGGMGAELEMRPGGRGMTGGSYPARIWGAFMNPLHEGHPVVGFNAPDPRGGGRYLKVEGGFDPGAAPDPNSTTTTSQPRPPDDPGDTGDPGTQPTFTIPTFPDDGGPGQGNIQTTTTGLTVTTPNLPTL